VRVIGEETLKTPERESEQAKLTVTGTLFQPSALGAIDPELVMTGIMRSISISAAVADAEFPALSTQVPVRDWSAPSEETT